MSERWHPGLAVGRSAFLMGMVREFVSDVRAGHIREYEIIYPLAQKRSA
jgi:hypothetical protein